MRYIVLLFFLFPTLILAQTSIFSGSVINSKAEPINGASVLVLNKNGKIITYSITDEKGRFNLELKTVDEEVIIKLSHIGYKIIKKQVSSTTNRSFEFILEEKEFELDEIVIKNSQVRDTMRLPIDSIRLTKISSLRDILNKTEGFNVSDNGGITFRGKKINKILVNKKEVFVNQNKIALDNLEYDIMKDVELINNYKDKFNIDFNNFSTSVLNINTKDKFKGVFKLFGDVATGIDEKVFLKLRAFYFSDQLNSFAISNTNNIGDKEFDFTNISNSFKIQSTNLFRNNFTYFFREDNLLKKGFNSNSSLILRKESDKSRMGFVAYYNNVDQEKNIFQTSQFEDNSILRKDSTRVVMRGNSLVGNFLYNRALSKKSVMSLRWNLIYSDIMIGNTISVRNFLPVVSINEQNRINSSSFLSSSEISFKSKISPKMILSSDFEFNLEHTDRNFISNYRIDNDNDFVSQDFDIENQSYNLDINIDYRVNKYISALFGGEFIYLNDKLFNNNPLSRDVYLTNLLLQARGQRKTWDYKLRVKQQLYRIDEENQDKIEFDLSANFPFNTSNNIGISYIQTNNLIDLYKSIDTLFTSFNTRIVNQSGITEQTITTAKSFSANYSYSSIIKSQSFSVNYSRREVSNDFQTILQSIDEGVLIYNYFPVDIRRESSVKARIGKGFYLTKKYHYLRIGGSAEIRDNKFPLFSIINQTSEIAKNNFFNYGMSIAIEPKNFVFNEIVLRYNQSNEKSFLEDIKLNEYDIYSTSASFNRNTEKAEIKIKIGLNTTQSEDFRFEIPFLNIDTNFKLSDKMELIAKGKYLFNLFDIGNIDSTSLNVVSNGNIINSVYTRDNINYLIVGINYKF